MTTATTALARGVVSASILGLYVVPSLFVLTRRERASARSSPGAPVPAHREPEVEPV